MEDAINEVLKEQLEEEEYDPRSSRQMAKTLSTIITNRVKALDFPRYKIVSLVTVGQLDDQGIRVVRLARSTAIVDSFCGLIPVSH